MAEEVKMDGKTTAKVCPLMGYKPTASPGFGPQWERVECLRDGCALWVEKKKVDLRWVGCGLVHHHEWWAVA